MHALRDKSFDFSVEVVLFSQAMINSNEYILSKHLVRSGTAIGALLWEAQYAESRADFIHKYSIGLKEANETEYWVDLIFRTYPAWKENIKVLKALCKELIAMLVAAIKTLKEKLLLKRTINFVLVLSFLLVTFYLLL